MNFESARKTNPFHYPQSGKRSPPPLLPRAMAVKQIGLSDGTEECVDTCIEAAEMGEWCADQCADHGKGMARCLRLCRDVADLASLCARGSEFNSQVAEACEACAEECEQHDHDHCQAPGVRRVAGAWHKPSTQQSEEHTTRIFPVDRCRSSVLASVPGNTTYFIRRRSYA